MKRALFILVGGLLLAAAGYCALYFLATASHRSLLASDTPELFWLKKEFNLGAAEFARVSRLHEAYLPQCKERCRRIAELSASKLEAPLPSWTIASPSMIAEVHLRLEAARMIDG